MYALNPCQHSHDHLSRKYKTVRKPMQHNTIEEQLLSEMSPILLLYNYAFVSHLYAKYMVQS